MKVLNIIISIFTGILIVFFFYIHSLTAASPVVFYSDLTSGPNTGGQDNKGVFVTICGKNFGSPQGSSYVTIGGEQADNYPVWTDTKICFQLGTNASTGDIVVHTSESNSNGVPFVVRPGNIYFVDGDEDIYSGSWVETGSGTYNDPWKSPYSYYLNMAPGDTCYIRGGTYIRKYGHYNHYNVGIGSAAPHGSADNEVAWAAYPGETVAFRARGRVSDGQTMDGCFDIDQKDYYTISGFDLYSSGRQSVRIAGKNNRIINNDCRGTNVFTYSLINPAGCSNSKIYGNKLRETTTGNKLTHPLYIGYGSDNTDFAWNHIYDNDVGEGPLISINQDNADINNIVFENIYIHDNIIDCRKLSGTCRALGIVATDTGSSVYIYNNVIIEGGGDVSWNYCLYQLSASSYFYNNTIYNSKGSYTFHLYTITDGGNVYEPEEVEIKNNIFYNQSGCDYVLIENEGDMDSVTVDYNCYYGNGNGPARDTHAVNDDPLFENPILSDFHLQGTSPCIITGYDTSSVVTRDKDGILRPQNSIVDIGAYEYSGTYLLSTNLSAPVLISPLHDIWTNDNTPFFDWSDVTSAEQYNIQVADDSNFISLQIDATNTNSTYIPFVSINDGTNYWRVRAWNQSQGFGPFSEIRIIKIDTASTQTPVNPESIPVIFYSDLTSGPNTGGQDNNGVFVTICGKNFGSPQGSSYVTIGGGQADNYPVWTDTKICFQLGANATTGDIVVHTAEGNSSGVSFVVRPGNIYFVDDTSPNDPGTGTYSDPWRSPASYYDNMQAGDTCYIRAGIYTGKYGHTTGAWQIAWNSSKPNGTENNEIAWVSYPNEIARFEANTPGTVEGNFAWFNARNYYIVAGFQLYAIGQCGYIAGENNRFINNDCEGLKTHAYAIINPVYCDGVKIYGNVLHGARSGDKLDHPIYVGRGSDNVDIGWNYIYDNDVAQGPVISVNNDGAIPNGYKFENILIHDNLIDCRNSSTALRAIGFIAQDVGSYAKVYNNIIIEGGGTGWYCCYQLSGSVDWYNNSFYNIKGSAAFRFFTGYQGLDLYKPEIIRVKDNIIHVESGCDYYHISDETNFNLLDIDYNCYYGNGNGPARDTHAVNADPLFEDPGTLDFHLQETSSCINAGYDTASVVTRDKDGIPRPQDSIVDIGAYEYSGAYIPSTNTNISPPSAPDIVNILAVSSNQIDLVWNDLTNETSYTLFRNLLNDTNTASNIVGLSADQTNYNDTGLAPDTLYFYWLKAYNPAGSSGFSAVASNTTLSSFISNTNVNTNSLSAYWKLDENSDITAYDSEGSNHGTVYGALWTTGKMSNALQFNGSDNYVEVPHSATFNIDQEITLSAWIKTPNAVDGSTRYIVYKHDLWGIAKNSAGNLYAYTKIDGIERFINSGMILPDNVWVHVAYTFDGDVMRIYTNASLLESVTNAGNMDVSTNSVRIGMHNSKWYWNGTIDDVHIYNHALSQSEIQAQYDSGDTSINETSIQLIEPVDYKYINDTTPLFVWKENTNVNKYWLQISDKSTFDPLIMSKSNISTTNYIGTNLSDNNYFWRVKGHNIKSDQWDDWTVESFNIDTQGPEFTILNRDLNTVKNKETTITWSEAKDKGIGFDKFVLIIEGEQIDIGTSIQYKIKYKNKGHNRITIRAYDKLGNYSENSTDIHVMDILPEGETKAYPNPIPRKNSMTIEYGYNINKTVSEIKFMVYNISGNVVLNKSYAHTIDGRIKWDLKTGNNGYTAPGLYIYRIIIKYSDGTDKATKFKKIAVK